jgi:hypothetical protein
MSIYRETRKVRMFCFVVVFVVVLRQGSHYVVKTGLDLSILLP